MEEKQKVKCEKCGKECANLGAHLRFCKGNENIEKTNETPAEPVVKKSKLTVELFNTSGKQVPQEDYFFNGIVIPGFEKVCGKPVDREDLLAVFDRVFKPSDNFLFYKVLDKEVYIVIIPLKFSKDVSKENNSLDGEFQKHAISFLNEGSVNLDTLRMKLDRIPKFCKFDNR